MKNVVSTSRFAAPSLKPHKLVSVKIKALDISGVSVVAPQFGIHGLIKASSFGSTTAERRAAMSAYHVGQYVMVSVERYNPQNGLALFVLPSGQATSHANTALEFATKKAKKPMKMALPKGTQILVDASNVLKAVHDFLPEYAAVDVLRALEEGVTAAGYAVTFVLDLKTFWWNYYNMPTEKREVWHQFCNEKVTNTVGEADETLLQLASTMSDSIILSNDRFRDYAKLYPELVGSTRVHTFTVMHNGVHAVTISGVQKVFLMQHFLEEATPPLVEECNVVAPELECIETRVYEPVTSRASEVAEGVSSLRRKVVEHDAQALYTLATYYAEGVGVHQDFSKSVRLDRAAQKAQKRAWQEGRRRRRMRANQAFLPRCA